MKSTIRTKFTVGTLLLIILTISLVSLLNYRSMKQEIIKEIESDNFVNLENVNNYFLKNFMKEMENFVNEWANDSQIKTYKKPDGTMKLVRTVPSNFDEIIKSWKGFAKSNYDIAWIYFANEEDGGIYIEPLDPTMPLDYDCRSREWYKNAIANSEKVVWTKPYVDAGQSGEVIITIAKAVVEEGQIKGVIGADIKLTKFSGIMGNVKFKNDGLVMLVDNSGYVFAHPDKRMLGENLMTSKWFEQIFLNESGMYIEEVNGVESIVSYIQLENVDWKLISISPLDFKKQIIMLRNRGIQVAFIAFIIVFILGRLLSAKLIAPLENIMNTIYKISSGDINARSSVSSNDEFKILGNELNRMLDKLNKSLEEEEKYTLEIGKNYISTVAALANAIEANDYYTGGHCNRVRDVANEIAIEMKLYNQQLKDLEFASLLHDIGKIGISSSILTKETSLTKEEFDKIKEHPKIGCNILKDIEFLQQARIIIIQHHERIDGTGYPYRINGSEISLSAKILSVADAYDAMTSSRYYRKIPLTHDEAMNQLESGKNTQFDENVVEKFKGCSKNIKLL